MHTLPQSPSENELARFSLRHLNYGWWSLLLFLTLGIILEIFHGFKTGWYLNVSNQTRRLMWTLAHAHGTLLAVVQIAFGLTVRNLPRWGARPRRIAGASLTAATVLVPFGFLLGGIVIYSGDPGLGILLVPLGALLLFLSVFLTARALSLRNLGPAVPQANPTANPPNTSLPSGPTRKRPRTRA
jgi:hypothetical protein